MERNTPKNGLVNLVAAALIFIGAFVVTVFVNSLAGIGASIFLGLGALIAFTSWFQTRLEENERLEKLEMDELARGKGESALFEVKESEVFPSRRSREQFEKFFVPAFAILLLLIEAGLGWWLWQRIGKTTEPIVTAKAMASLALFGIFALLLFLLGRFSVTMARLDAQRLLRPGANFLLAGAYICFLTALAIAGTQAGFLKTDAWLGRAFCVLLGLMAVENLLTLLLEIYRPRVKGKIVRPLYDSRLVGILAQPESLFTTAAQTLDYQFGFKVSETWFFKLLKENLPVLLMVQFLVLILSSCFVFVEPGEQVVLEHFGKPVATLNSGAHLKLPWPVDIAYRYRTDQIQSLYVGYTPETNAQSTILWTIAHNKEENFLVGNRLLPETQRQLGEAAKAPPVSLITISIPVLFQITDVRAWAYNNADPTNLLSDLATREVVQYLAGADMSDVISHARMSAATELQQRIQAAVDAHHLGAKIVFVGLQDIHPPTAVAASYEEYVGSFQKMIATTNNAVAEAIYTNTLAGAMAFSATNTAEAWRIQKETAAFANAALFTNQIPAFDAAPSVYEQRAYFQAFADATKNSRKYILLVTNTQDVLIFNLEDAIRPDLLNSINPPSE
ncbi:MAG TPA: SPFH domain-containing protein [Verrucomicrobiae bacterium]|nr:SPFH domain-containing protein [Verrucomicrobiae bacterium]